MRNVLIVGGSGFLGQHTVKSLVQAGDRVWATHSVGKTPPPLRDVQWLATDLTSSQATDSWPRDCDAVIFLAQARNWRNFPACAGDVFRVNLDALLQTAQYAQTSGAKKLLVASTGTVYASSALALREMDVIDCNASRTFYAASKLAAEILLGPYTKYLDITQLRIFMPYGSGINSDMLFPQLVKRVQTGQPITLQGFDGMRVNPIAAADVAEAFRRALDLVGSSVLNLAGSSEWTLREVGETIGKILGLAPRFEHQPNVPAPVVVGDISALCQALCWTPSIDLEEGLRSWLQVESTGRLAG